MNEKVSQYIQQAPPGQQRIMETIRNLLHAHVPGLVEDFKWNRPVYAAGKEFAYLKTAKSYVTLGFDNGASLDDPERMLEGEGKNMRHIKIRNAEEINEQQLLAWFHQASQLP